MKDTSVKFQCPHCEFKGRDGQRINLHILRMHEHHAKSHQCSLCEKTFAFELYAKEHEKRTHLVSKVKCESCDKDYSSKGQLNIHIRTVHKGIRYNCETCDYKTTQKAHLKAHINGVHENIRSFICSSCGHMSRTKHTLAIHMVVHQAERPMSTCPECSKEILTASLKSHIREIHMLAKTVKCEKYEKTFKKKDHLRLHLRNVHENKLVPCK